MENNQITEYIVIPYTGKIAVWHGTQTSHEPHDMVVCVCALFFQKATFVANESLLGSFPDKSIPWKASFVANEGLLGTYMVSSRVDSV